MQWFEVIHILIVTIRQIRTPFRAHRFTFVSCNVNTLLSVVLCSNIVYVFAHRGTSARNTGHAPARVTCMVELKSRASASSSSRSSPDDNSYSARWVYVQLQYFTFTQFSKVLSRIILRFNKKLKNISLTIND